MTAIDLALTKEHRKLKDSTTVEKMGLQIQMGSNWAERMAGSRLMARYLALTKEHRKLKDSNLAEKMGLQIQMGSNWAERMAGSRLMARYLVVTKEHWRRKDRHYHNISRLNHNLLMYMNSILQVLVDFLYLLRMLPLS